MTLSRRTFVKTTAVLGASLAAGTLAACAAEGATPEPAPEAPAEKAPAEDAATAAPETAAEAAAEPATPADPEPEPADDSLAAKARAAAPVLVAYYSNTGNTGRIAEMIASAMDAEMFVIEPVDPYTAEDTNWRDESSRVSQEMPRRSEVDVELVQVTPDGFARYKTVFVGYPIWWQSFSWVLNEFVRENDFSGKTVIPFCTSSSSPLGESDQALAAEADGGDWLPGERFASGTSEEEVRAWLESLPL